MNENSRKYLPLPGDMFWWYNAALQMAINSEWEENPDEFLMALYDSGNTHRTKEGAELWATQ